MLSTWFGKQISLNMKCRWVRFLKDLIHLLQIYIFPRAKAKPIFFFSCKKIFLGGRDLKFCSFIRAIVVCRSIHRRAIKANYSRGPFFFCQRRILELTKKMYLLVRSVGGGSPPFCWNNTGLPFCKWCFLTCWQVRNQVGWVLNRRNLWMEQIIPKRGSEALLKFILCSFKINTPHQTRIYCAFFLLGNSAILFLWIRFSGMRPPTYLPTDRPIYLPNYIHASIHL